jgi:hypothetical protein
MNDGEIVRRARSLSLHEDYANLEYVPKLK